MRSDIIIIYIVGRIEPSKWPDFSTTDKNALVVFARFSLLHGLRIQIAYSLLKDSVRIKILDDMMVGYWWRLGGFYVTSRRPFQIVLKTFTF